MTGLSLGEQRLQINTVLTHIALGRKPKSRVGCAIFPIAPVNLMGGNKVIKFTNAEFASYNSRRAPGDEYVRISRGYLDELISLEYHGLEYPLNDDMRREQRKSGIGDDYRGASQFLMNVLSLEHERECAAIAMNPDNYSMDTYEVLVGTDKWSHPDSDIIQKIEDSKEKIRSKIGTDPNVAVFSAKVVAKMRGHKQFSRITDAGSRIVVTEKQLEQEFGFEKVFIGKATGVGADDEFFDVWSNGVWMGYTDPIALARMSGKQLNWFNAITRSIPGVAAAPVDLWQRREPSFGYTYMMQGHPYLPNPYREEQKDNTVFKIKADWGIHMTGMNAGFLLLEVT
ncbi:MAG: major capsid protein [Cyanobacteria bacterium SBLK]|nr:major capsid protein [Cyanobacteria bacterium SBLK]